jgi:hypothetical protein
MKKTSLLFAILLLANSLLYAQSVTLATTTVNPSKGTVVYNNGTNILQYWNGTAWIPIINAASGTGWALNGTHLRTTNSGYVGIGINSPEAPLSVRAEGIGISQESSDGVKMGFYTEGSSIATVQTHTSHDLTFATGNGSPTMTIKHSNKNIGIGTLDPANKLQIGSVGNTGFATNQLAIGNGTHAMAIYQTNTSTLIGASTDIVLKPRNNGAGRVGINIDNPTNIFQIGSVGSTGYAGNHIAFGNGTNVAGIAQTSQVLQIASTTAILLKPNNGSSLMSIGDGLVSTSNSRVGINTTTPRGPLDVISWTNTAAIPFAYFRRDENDGHVILNTTPSDIASVSIYAEKSVLATQFVAYSDTRIKNIVGISNSAQDLATIRALQITDYTMKDQVQYGNKPFKKVIAQQVEKVYPQAVSQITDVVPDIYALAETVVYDENKKTLKFSLANNYEIKAGEILQFIHPTAGKLKAEVIEVSGNSFTVKDWQHPTDKIFVYGREVNDFRSVDYEAISMLGISAIQQLAKENEELRMKNNEFSRRFEQLSARLETLEAQLPKPPTGK